MDGQLEQEDITFVVVGWNGKKKKKKGKREEGGSKQKGGAKM